MAFDPTTATLADAAPEFDPSTATLAYSGGSEASDGTDPTEGMSTTDKFLAGTGKGMVDTGRGVYQLGASIGHAAGMVSDEKMASIQQDVDNSRELDAPLMNTTAGKVGDVVGTAAPALLMPGAGIAGSAVEGAALGAAQPVASGDSRWTNTYMGGLGGAAGAAAGKVLGGVLGGFGGAKGAQEAADLLESENIPTSVGQVTKSKLAQSIERASAMTSDEPAEFAGLQQQRFNQAALRRVGVNNPDVTAATPQVLSDAKDAITGAMNAVSSRTSPRFDNTLQNDLVGVEQSTARMLPASDAGPITQHINDILENAAQNGGSLDGTFVRKLNTSLSQLSRNQTYAPIAGDLQEAVHDAVSRYALPDDAAAMAQAQRQFRALKQIEGATDNVTGDVSISGLINQMSTKAYGGRNQVLYAKGDQSLVDLARAAKRIMQDKLGNSGTAERTLPALTALEIAASGEPLKAGMKAGVSVGGLNAAGKALRNQGVLGTYLQNGIPGVRAAAPVIRRVAPALGYGAAESQLQGDATPLQDDATPRATGGKVDHEALVSRLFTRWKSAQKEADKSTEPLLKFPDASITKALRIAEQHIL
jgi:hypothetical protein